LETAPFHGLRDTFDSHLVMAGIDLIKAKVGLRQKSRVIAESYVQLSPGQKAEAVRVLDSGPVPAVRRVQGLLDSPVALCWLTEELAQITQRIRNYVYQVSN